jgi:hypothetical protein
MCRANPARSTCSAVPIAAFTRQAEAIGASAANSARCTRAQAEARCRLSVRTCPRRRIDEGTPLPQDKRPKPPGACSTVYTNLERTRDWISPPSGASWAVSHGQCPVKLRTSELVLRLTRRRAPKRRHLCRHPTKQPEGRSMRSSLHFATRHQQAGPTDPKANRRALRMRRSHMVARKRPKTSIEHHRSRKRLRGGRPPRSTSTSYGTRTPADDRHRPKTAPATCSKGI